MDVKLVSPDVVENPTQAAPKPTGPVEVKLGNPRNPNNPSAMEIAQKRDALANELRDNYPGEWAVISEGHVSKGSARQVRDRIKGRPCWAGFEWAVRQHHNNPDLHVIYAKAPGGTEDETPIEVRTATLDEISPTF